jgi:hypothetical protein
VLNGKEKYTFFADLKAIINVINPRGFTSRRERELFSMNDNLNILSLAYLESTIKPFNKRSPTQADRNSPFLVEVLFGS